jgi:hypothetical protein
MAKGEKRKGKKKGQSVARRNLLIGGAALVVLVLIGGLALSFWLYGRLRSDRPSVAVPTSFDTYDVPEGFHCEYPADWKARHEGVKDHYDWTCKRGAASVHISQGMVGSLLGDIAGALGGQDNNPEHSPVARVHEVKRRVIADEFQNYQEEPAQTVNTHFGQARRSAFTASGTFGRKIRGYRATALALQTQFDVVCQCPEADWENLQPAFARVIESLGPSAGP